MLLQILDYDLQIVYQEGSKMHLSDALSRLSLHKTEKGSTLPGMDITVHEVEASTNFSSVSLSRIQASYCNRQRVANPKKSHHGWLSDKYQQMPRNR